MGIPERTPPITPQNSHQSSHQKRALEKISEIYDPISVSFDLEFKSVLPAVQSWLEEGLLKGGKKLRPRLCLWMSEAADVPLAQVEPFARIAELVHAATLAHDDVIDHATLRRDRPTLNARLTQARAVLGGDLLLSRSMVELAELGSPELLRRMAEVLEDLVTGEWLQLEIRGQIEVTPRTIETIASLKTASLMAWCCEVPWTLKGAHPEVIRLARVFGTSLGKAFQFQDDALDFRTTSEKDLRKDLQEGLLNSVSVRLLQNERMRASVTSLEDWSKRFDEVTDSTELERALFEVEQLAATEIRFAEQALDQLQVHGGDKQNFAALQAALQQLKGRKK